MILGVPVNMPDNMFHRAALALVGVLVAGGIGWWMHYVTQGATMARKLMTEFKHLTDEGERFEKSLIEHEKSEERKFEEVREEIGAVRTDLAAIGRDVSGVHGKLDGIIQMIHNGSKK